MAGQIGNKQKNIHSEISKYNSTYQYVLYNRQHPISTTSHSAGKKKSGTSQRKAALLRGQTLWRQKSTSILDESPN